MQSILANGGAFGLIDRVWAFVPRSLMAAARLRAMVGAQPKWMFVEELCPAVRWGPQGVNSDLFGWEVAGEGLEAPSFRSSASDSAPRARIFGRASAN